MAYHQATYYSESFNHSNVLIISYLLSDAYIRKPINHPGHFHTVMRCCPETSYPTMALS